MPGAKLIAFDRYRDDCDPLVEQHAEHEAKTVVHAHDDPRMIAGAGTVAVVGVEPAANPGLGALVAMSGRVP